MKKSLILFLCIFSFNLTYAQNILSENATPKPLDSKLVYDLFSRVDKACTLKDGEMLFDQFSKRVQQLFIKNDIVSSNNPSFSSLSSYCDNTKKINDFFASKDIKFCSMADRGRVRLCSYEGDITLAEKHGVRITFEDNRLKFDEH